MCVSFADTNTTVSSGVNKFNVEESCSNIYPFTGLEHACPPNDIFRIQVLVLIRIPTFMPTCDAKKYPTRNNDPDNTLDRSRSQSNSLVLSSHDYVDVDVDAWTVLRQTHIRMETMWTEFVTCPLVSESGPMVGDNYSSFSIHAETRYLKLAEDAVRISLQQVHEFWRVVAPCDKSIDNTSTLQKKTSFRHPKSIPGPHPLLPVESIQRHKDLLDDTTMTWLNHHHDDNGSNQTLCHSGMSYVSSISNDDWTCHPPYPTGTTTTKRTLGQQIWWSSIIVSLADWFFGNRTYVIVVGVGSSRVLIRRSYPGTCCFFLVMAMTCVTLLDSHHSYNSIQWFVLVIGSATLLTLFQIYIPHHFDQVGIATAAAAAFFLLLSTLSHSHSAHDTNHINR